MPKYFAASSIVKRLFMAFQTGLFFMFYQWRPVRRPTLGTTLENGTYERVQNFSPYRKSRGGGQRRSVERVSTEMSLVFAGRRVSAATPLRHRVGRRRATCCRHRRVAPRDSTVPRAHPTHVKRCGTPVATAPSPTMSRLQPRVATHWEILLRPRVGEGRNTMVRRGRCANPVSESVHGRLGFRW